MRAVFAVAGFVLFYVVVAATIVGLAGLGIVIFGYLDDAPNSRVQVLPFMVGGTCFVAAGILAWSAIPRIDRFEPPGPELDEARHPALFAVIREVAEATKQAMPVHVYAVLDVNAFVTERGGIMGIGSRRVMGIGLGLLATFDVDEVRAVLAHELGHFHGGDTRLGPWVYKTRAAMGRAVGNLRHTAATLGEVATVRWILRIVEAPFRWMALAYMRLASTISRAQELSADAVAARAVGAEPVLSGFRRLRGTVAAYRAYLETELEVLVGMGVIPPVLVGAQQFIEANHEELAALATDATSLGEASPFDSHPPLAERIAAVERLATTLPPARGARDGRVAIELVHEPEQLAREIIAKQVGNALAPIEWSVVASHHLAAMHQRLRRHQTWLAPRSVEELDLDLATARVLSSGLEGIGDHTPWLDERSLRVIQRELYTAAVSVALEHVGYQPAKTPGKPLELHRDGEAIEPRAIVAAYLAGELAPEAWAAYWARAGLPAKPWDGIAWKTSSWQLDPDASATARRDSASP